MNRAIILILDSLGLGASADAAKYGDQNSDTFGHIVEACEDGLANNDQRQGPLKIPNLLRWGLGAASVGSRKRSLPLETHVDVQGAYGHAVEVSSIWFKWVTILSRAKRWLWLMFVPMNN